MVAVEVVLILIGVAFLVGSFFITERLSQQDLEHISMMSESDLKHIAEKQVKEMKIQVENSIEEIIDESLEITQRGLERETNNKIMAVSEYSDTIMETMNKTHNEIMFLYSMLNDKHAETAEIVGDLQKYAKQLSEFDMDAALEKMEKATKYVSAKKVETVVEKEPVVLEEVVEAEVSDTESSEQQLTKNERILLLHKEGMNEVEIAKALDCGMGEVRLVLGLYNEV